MMKFGFGLQTLLGAGVVAGALLSGAAHGLPMTFEFGENGTGSLVGSGDDTGYAASIGVVDLLAMGYKGVDLGPVGEFVTASFDDTEEITRDTSGGSQGLAVDSEAGDDDGRIDGDGPDEAIRFDLGLSGYITAIQFDNFGGDDDFNLILDGLVALVDVGGLAQDQWQGRLAYNDWFAIGADGASDEFRIRSVTVDVPEPGLLGLLALGIAGFLPIARRRVAISGAC